MGAWGKVITQIVIDDCWLITLRRKLNADNAGEMKVARLCASIVSGKIRNLF